MECQLNRDSTIQKYTCTPRHTHFHIRTMGGIYHLVHYIWLFKKSSIRVFFHLMNYPLILLTLCIACSIFLNQLLIWINVNPFMVTRKKSRWLWVPLVVGVFMEITICMAFLCLAWLGASTFHDDVMEWKHFPRYWPFVREIHQSPVNSPNKSQWRGTLMFSLIYGWVHNREAGYLRRHIAHCDVIVMHIHTTMQKTS